MNLNVSSFKDSLKNVITNLSSVKMFKNHRSLNQAELAWLLDFNYPQTYEDLFSEITRLPYFPKDKLQPFCDAVVIYSLLTAMRENLKESSALLEVGKTRFQNGEIALRNGSVSVQDDIFVEIGSLFLTGNLSIQGNLSDWDESSNIIILGNMVATNMSSSGEVVVGGNLKVDNILHLHRNDHALRVEGDISCRYLINNDHSVKIGGSLNVERILDPNKDADLDFMRSHLKIIGISKENNDLIFESDEYHASFFAD
jgi:hypothetical protein